MIVVAGGDSFVWGSELSDSPHGGLNGYSRNTFPALLASSSDYYCAAYPGLCNSEIAQNLKTAIRELPVIPFVIVCWTWPSRDKAYSSPRVIQEFQNYCEYHNYPYLFTCADNCLLEWLGDTTNWNNWFLFPEAKEEWNTTKPRGFYQWAVENKYSTGPDNHPLELAHKDAANLMQGKFDELVKKYIQENCNGNTLPQKT